MTDPKKEPLGYQLDHYEWLKLKSVSKALNNPNLKVDWDKRRDLANLIDAVCDSAFKIYE